MSTVSFRALDPASPGVFSQYLLPEVRHSAARGDTLTVLGAVWDTLACAAAAVRWDGDGGELVSLFVDPRARRYGIARRMLDLLLEEAAQQGVEALTARYVLRGEDLAAMDALFADMGAPAECLYPVCGMDSTLFHRSVLSAAFKSDYSPAREIVPFAELGAEATAALEVSPDIPAYLRPSACRGRMDPSLSVAWVKDGRVLAYLLGGSASMREYVLLSAWSGQKAPASAFLSLLRAQLNVIWFRAGGDFRYFTSPVTEQSAMLLERITKGSYELYEEHTVTIPVQGKPEVSL